MQKFQITQKHSGHHFGVYEAEDEDGAVEALARDAGYASFRDLCSITDPEDIESEIERQRAQLIVVMAGTD